MAKPKRKIRKRVKVRHRARVVKKGSVKNDTIPKMSAQMPRTAGTTFKVKLKRKND